MNQNSAESAVDQSEELFLEDVIDGLSKSQKQLPCKYFYDERGSQLFDQICEVDEYYLTRTEQQIMLDHAEEMADQLGSQIMLVEFGSGSSIKTQVLLNALEDPVAYVPIDISEEHLLKTTSRLRRRYPDIEILPLVTDFTQSFELPVSARKPSHAAVYFPGSTIGNFTPQAAAEMLVRISGMLGPQGGLLIGIDLQKDPTIIEAAYNDAEGVTDEFNLNVLHRVNRELDADFDVDQFHHKAIYNPLAERVEIFVVSQCDQTVNLNDHEFEFTEGEHILTEYSHKYTIDGFVKLASQADFTLHRYWKDKNDLFAVLHLVNEQE